MLKSFCKSVSSCSNDKRKRKITFSHNNLIVGDFNKCGQIYKQNKENEPKARFKELQRRVRSRRSKVAKDEVKLQHHVAERRKNCSIGRGRRTERRAYQILGGTSDHQLQKKQQPSHLPHHQKISRDLLSSMPPVKSFPKTIFNEETTKTERQQKLRVRTTQAVQMDNCKLFAETQTDNREDRTEMQE